MAAAASAALLAWLPLCLAVPVRLFPSFAEPADHPNVARRWAKVPGGEVLPRTSTRFAGYRGGCSEQAFADYAKQGLGDLWWPQYPVLETNDATLSDCLEAVLKANLTTMDISNYVPGDTDVCSPVPSEGVCEYHLPRAKLDLLQQILGDSFLGMDNGEQDGRYMAYAAQMARAGSSPRAEQFLQFTRHFQRMSDDLGSKLMSLNSLYYPHYFARTGLYTLLGSESAQGLPNDQLYYSFLRGAAKQYGNLLWASPSIYNRWGYKSCNATGCSPDGTSLSLLKRLLYTEVMYQCSVFGYEGAMLDGGALTPIGRMQHAGIAFVTSRAQVLGSVAGTMMSTVAVLLDFYSGFTPPRHLYSGDLYRVWGNLPYDISDHYSHGVLDLLYPGYERASFFHDEHGFLAGTPFGDVADVLLSDAPLWLLFRYAVILVGGALSALPREARRKLEAYVAAGGTAVLTADTLQSLGGAFGVRVAEAASATPQPLPAGTEFQFSADPEPCPAVREAYPSELLRFVIASGVRSSVLASARGLPAALLVQPGGSGGGRAILLASTGVASERQGPSPVVMQEDQPLPVPFPLLSHVRQLLENALRSRAALFTSGEQSDLSVVVGRHSAGRYTVTVANNALEERPFVLKSNIGSMRALSEVSLDQSEKQFSGYLPKGFEHADIGKNTNSSIAGGDIRWFDVEVEEVASLIDSPPAPGVKGRFLPVLGSPHDAVLSRPTFHQHWDGAVVEWRHLERSTPEALIREGRWALQAGVRLLVDFTSGLNLYPDLRLCNNSAREFEASLARIEAVLAKMALPVNASTATLSSGLYSHDAILTAHRTPENYYTAEQCHADFVAAFKRLSAYAAARGLTVHLRTQQNKLDLKTALDIMSSVQSPALRLAPSTALLQWAGVASAAELRQAYPTLDPKSVGLWLAAAPAADPLVPSSLLSAHAPLLGAAKGVAAIVAFAVHAPVALDAAFPDLDAEVEDADAFAEALLESSSAVPGRSGASPESIVI